MVLARSGQWAGGNISYVDQFQRMCPSSQFIITSDPKSFNKSLSLPDNGSESSQRMAISTKILFLFSIRQRTTPCPFFRLELPGHLLLTPPRTLYIYNSMRFKDLWVLIVNINKLELCVHRKVVVETFVRAVFGDVSGENRSSLLIESAPSCAQVEMRMFFFLCLNSLPLLPLSQSPLNQVNDGSSFWFGMICTLQFVHVSELRKRIFEESFSLHSQMKSWLFPFSPLFFLLHFDSSKNGSWSEFELCINKNKLFRIRSESSSNFGEKWTKRTLLLLNTWWFHLTSFSLGKPHSFCRNSCSLLTHHNTGSLNQGIWNKTGLE